MNRYSTVLLMFLFAWLGFAQAMAQRAETFSKAGLRYTVLGEGEVSVCYNDDDTTFLRNRVVIPSQVTNPKTSTTYSVVALADTAFKRCDLITTLVLPATLQRTGRNIVDHCFNLTAFEVEEGATSFSVIDGVLFNVDATQLVCFPAGKAGDYDFPATVRSIAPTAFSTCKNIRQLTISEGVKDIPAYTFFECWGLAQVQFPESLETIGDYAFDGTILQFLYFYKNLKSIGGHAFERSSMVECILLCSVPPALGEDVFGHDMNYTRLYVPAGSTARYKATQWSIFPTIYQGSKSRRWTGKYR